MRVDPVRLLSLQKIQGSTTARGAFVSYVLSITMDTTRPEYA